MRKPDYPRLLAFVAILALPASQAGAGTIDNNSIWRDTQGREIKAQGGCIFQEGATFHWIGPEFESTDFHFRAVNRYTSTDLQNWTRQAPILTPTTPGLSSVPISSTTWVGRPWVIKRGAADYVMWIEAGKLSGSAFRNRFAVFHAADIAGPWTFGTVYASLPDGAGTQYALGDMGAYHDLSTGNAYLLYTFDKGEANGYQAIVKLSPDFRKILPPEQGGVVAEFPKSTYYGQEAAAIFKRGSIYYHIMSDTRGWRPSVTRYRTATAIGPASAWSALQEVRMNPAGSAFSFRTQHDFVLPVTGTDTTTFIFIGDRWSLYDTTDYAGAVGRQAWFRMTFDAGGRPTIDAPNFALDGGDWHIDPVTGSAGSGSTTLRFTPFRKNRVLPISQEGNFPYSAIRGRYPFNRWEGE